MTTFAALHHGPAPMLLPNAWDVTSALTFARAGHPAVGTTSSGVAASLARPDGDRASAEAGAARRHPVPGAPAGAAGRVDLTPSHPAWW
ncbi:isocitrate lyase/phosphoenolpyruvate mutase family protein [Actinomycetospora flava]|uniref:Isocitrate lyase/phosphoenolpyruvate mutase family protein n=1 Tax=Actinomycetospora flava TaxID=3129232 RepID=A0ABU8MAT9_9PSEU